MINLYMHGGSGNHGCEAIVRSTVKMLGRQTKVYSSDTSQDVAYGLNRICDVENEKIEMPRRGTKEWFLSAVQTKLTGRIDLAIKYRYKNFYSQIKKGETFLSVGGDNYCYAGTDILAARNYNLRRKKCKTVLWGCSVEPELLKDPIVKEDISKFDLITARESISYEALRKINKNTYLVSDPAFLLDRIDLPLPEGWKEGNMIGINASPLILSSSNKGELIVEAYERLIERVFEITDCSIALIPHVVWQKNDDRDILRRLFDKYKESGRIILVNDCNCMELKGYIARCRMFVGARTHATIAAYSSFVPTLVLGYSVKSKGIARDIFGTEEKYVLPVQNIQKTDELAKGFEWLLANEIRIQEYLKKVMPEHKARAEKGRALLENEVIKK